MRADRLIQRRGETPHHHFPRKAFELFRGRRPSRVARMGPTGPDVEDLRTALGIAVDGDFGPDAKEAVIAFQTGKGLEANIIVGANRWKALEL